MNNIIALDYQNKTELTFTFLFPTLKELWSHRHYEDEWQLIDSICETTSARITQPLFSKGFIIKEKRALGQKSGQIDTLTLAVQFVCGLPQLDIDLITYSLQQDSIISALLSMSYQDQNNNTVMLS